MVKGDISIVVLSAGMGRRFGGLKQIKPVGPSGEVILDYSLYDARRAGFSNVIFVIRKEIEEDFRRFVGKYWEEKFNVNYVFQEIDSFLPEGICYSPREKPWGTAHALLVCKAFLNSPFAVINADDFYGFEPLSLAFGALANNEYILISYKLEETLSPHGHVSRAICEIDDNSYLLNLTEFQKIGKEGGKIIARRDSEMIELKGNEQVSMNLFGFPPSIFDFLESEFQDFLMKKGDDSEAEFLIPEVIGNLVRNNKVKIKVIPTSSMWFGVTHPEDAKIARSKIKELIKSGKYPERLRG